MQSCLPHVGSLNPISLAQELVVLSPSAGQLCLMNTGLQTIIQSHLYPMCSKHMASQQAGDESRYSDLLNYSSFLCPGLIAYTECDSWSALYAQSSPLFYSSLK